MHRLLIKIFICFFLLTGAACSGFEELKVETIRSIEIKGFEGNKLSITIVLPVENPNAYKVKVKKANILVMKDNVELGRVVQMSNLVIQGKTRKDYPLDLTIELTGFRGDLFSMYNLFRNRSNLRMQGDLTAGYLLYSKKVKIDYPLEY